MPRRCRSLRRVRTITRRVNLPSGNIAVEQGAVEDLVCSVRLVGWNFMTSLVDTRERKVAVLTNLAANVRGVRADGRIACSAEGRRRGMFHSQTHVFATNPIAGIVAISVD